MIGLAMNQNLSAKQFNELCELKLKGAVDCAKIMTEGMDRAESPEIAMRIFQDCWPVVMMMMFS